jgi:Fe-S cluster biogenesis protein NfuA
VSVDRAQLQRRIEALNVLLRSHAGEIELAGVSAEGVVSLRYTGMCAGCDYRPVTTLGTVAPALHDLAQVTKVEIVGAKVSAEAHARIAASLEGSGAAARAIRLVRRIETQPPEQP